MQQDFYQLKIAQFYNFHILEPLLTLNMSPDYLTTGLTILYCGVYLGRGCEETPQQRNIITMHNNALPICRRSPRHREIICILYTVYQGVPKKPKVRILFRNETQWFS